MEIFTIILLLVTICSGLSVIIRAFRVFFHNLLHDVPLKYCFGAITYTFTRSKAIIPKVTLIIFIISFILLMILSKNQKGKEALDKIKKFLKIKSKKKGKEKEMATNTNEVNLRAQNQFKKLLDEHNTEHGFTSEEDQAKLFARAIETQMLKSPSSAKWPDLSDIVVAKEEDNTYKVLGYCEAQNSNGVYLREEYKFNLKLSPDGTWETTDSFISTADAIRQQTKNDINEMNTQAHANALVYFIIISIIGLAIWFIEMAYLGF